MPWPLVSNPEAMIRKGGAEDVEIEMAEQVRAVAAAASVIVKSPAATEAVSATAAAVLRAATVVPTTAAAAAIAALLLATTAVAAAIASATAAATFAPTVSLTELIGATDSLLQVRPTWVHCGPVPRVSPGTVRGQPRLTGELFFVLRELSIYV